MSTDISVLDPSASCKLNPRCERRPLHPPHPSSHPSPIYHRSPFRCPGLPSVLEGASTWSLSMRLEKLASFARATYRCPEENSISATVELAGKLVEVDVQSVTTLDVDRWGLPQRAQRLREPRETISSPRTRWRCATSGERSLGAHAENDVEASRTENLMEVC